MVMQSKVAKKSVGTTVILGMIIVFTGVVTGCSRDAVDPGVPLLMELDLRCQPEQPTEVRMSGGLWGWVKNAGPVALDEDGDGIWSVLFEPAPDEDMLYLWLLDGTFESLFDAGECAPDTDGTTYANRLWRMGEPNRIDTYETCEPCNPQAMP